MANKNFKVRQGLEAPLIAADDGTTAITLTGANVAVVGTLDVQGGTITDSTGALTITSGATNTNLTLDPNGTGNVVLTFANGGNLTNDRNYVFGAIRNATTAGLGDIWAINTTGTVGPTRGISIDNSVDTTKTASYLARTYGAAAGNRSRLIFERARGTAASPTAVQSGDFLGEVDVTGYTSTGWLNDTVSAVPGFFGFTASESWVSNTNLGTSFGLNLAPTATTVTSGANLITTIASNPQGLALRGDVFSVAQGKTTSLVATGCSTSGTTLTIGTVTSGTVAVGQQIQTSTNAFSPGTYIVANLSGSGSGSTWTLSTSQTTSSQTVVGVTGFIGSPSAATTIDALQDLRLLKNTIKGSGGTTQITTSSAGATLALAGDTITLENAAGTDFVVIDANTAKFNVPVTTEITTTTISEGTTYTPAATVDNNISVQIDTLAGGTTVIDLASLTGNSRGASYNILVFNNTASGTPIQVKNTRINTNNLMTHTITTGNRIIINAYVVGDYATATHFVVA